MIFTNSGDPQPWLELREENLQLLPQVQDKEEQAAELARVQEELEGALERVGELETAEREAVMLKGQIARLEQESSAIDEAREEARRSEVRYHDVTGKMAREVQVLEQRLGEEHEARRQLEGRATWYEREYSRLKASNQELQVRLERQPAELAQLASEVVQPMKQELAQLRPLKVWAGHPCADCGKPLTGVPTREVAGRILRKGRLVHGRCANN